MTWILLGLGFLPQIPSKGFIAYDEPGISIGHRTWLSPANQAINIVSQSFRYKLINVIFALPSRYYLDKVPREMCYYEVMMQRRGMANVYKILKSAFADMTYTKFLGVVHLGLPSKSLAEEYEKLRAGHQDALYERLRQEQEVIAKKHEESLKKELEPERTFMDDTEKAMLILPEIVDVTRDTDFGLISVPNLKKAFLERLGINLAHNRSYYIRAELLRRLHANNDALLKKLRGEVK